MTEAQPLTVEERNQLYQNIVDVFNDQCANAKPLKDYCEKHPSEDLLELINLELSQRLGVQKESGELQVKPGEVEATEKFLVQNMPHTGNEIVRRLHQIVEAGIQNWEATHGPIAVASGAVAAR